MFPKLSLILGGADSGKTAFAERLVTGSGLRPVYLATGEALDAEMGAKIEKHRATRGPGWRTVEAPRDAAGALDSIEAGSCVLLDCATMWLSNQMLGDAEISGETDRLLAAISACAGPVVIVSNELGLGLVPDTTLGRGFRSAQGQLNQALAARADLAVFIVASL
ncbi:MAG: bifunctional adenosylcobinamide kinase/adenosylcobinamide-phosphate guanylyltransferase, partial [Paracoccaceae bacterium]|nr:bifunctional adenosylcobinamide kinase/adenosylcobinamide-phosphate guanylyltransferase [Paracoccaceae bacterium]